MFLTELTISRLPSSTARADGSNITPDYSTKIKQLKARSGITDERLNALVADQKIPPEFQDDAPLDDELPPEEDLDTELDEPTEEPQDPNYAGLLRVVPKAHLVYKREQPDGTYTELWNYKVTTVKDTVKLRNAILSGTDIERTQLRSADGVQGYDLWSVGNIEILKITGLPN